MSGERRRLTDAIGRTGLEAGLLRAGAVSNADGHGDGGDTQNENDPYRTFIYTSFQEIATRISHLNVGKLAREHGAELLYSMSARIAGDENRHARAYKAFISKIIEVDPSEAVLAFQDMMKKKITMPAMYMRERGAVMGDTFKKFEAVAGRLKSIALPRPLTLDGLRGQARTLHASVRGGPDWRTIGRQGNDTPLKPSDGDTLLGVLRWVYRGLAPASA